MSTPDVVLAPGTPRGMEVLAHLAARLDVAMAANVVAVGDWPTPLVVTRQVSGGAVLEEMRLAERPALFTVAGHAVEAAAGRRARRAAAVRELVRRGRRRPTCVARVVAHRARGAGRAPAR